MRITKSGCYCLANRIKEQIIIDADHVCLDLNCKVVDGNGCSVAILANGRKDITVKNGAIKNDGKTGLEVSDCGNVILEDLRIHPVNEAIVLLRCNHGTLSRIKANHNENKTRGVIFLRDCKDFCLTDRDRSKNKEAILLPLQKHVV